MPANDDEERLLRSVALQNASSILIARQRAEEELIRAKNALELKTAELSHTLVLLQRQSEWLRVTLSSIGDAVITTDADGHVTFLNGVAVALTGWTMEEALGQPLGKLFQIFNESTRQPVENPALRALREGMVVGLANHTVLIDKHGKERPIDDSAAPMRNDAGAVIGSVLVFRDITERHRAEEERERLLRELQQADRRKDEFLALLAHELRNPLAPLRNGLQVLRLGGSTEAGAKARDMMDRQLGHMVRIVDDLLDISRISRNKIDLQRTRIALTEVVSNAVETARPLIDAAGHDLIVELPPAAVELDADLTRLAQVFANLLINSAKYTMPGGTIWLTAERRNGEIAIAVRDTGLGIPLESLPRIFDMFAQVERSTERSTGGLGIGLALVKGLVEMHGGTVEVHSDGPDTGSTFTVRLPALDEGSVEATAGHIQEEPRSRTVRKRVLVVDDNRDGAESMAEMLALLGHEVHTAHDGIEAFEATERLRPDVVLMDVGMPRLNGLDATRKIREQPWSPEVTVIALTGWGQEEDRIRSREAGCNGHLVKPVCLSDLEKLLRG